MTDPRDATTIELVKRARELERMMRRRRELRKKLADLEQSIRTTRHFINELSRPFISVALEARCPECNRFMESHTPAELVACEAKAIG